MICKVKANWVHPHIVGTYDNKPTFKSQIDVASLAYGGAIQHEIIELNINSTELVEYSKIEGKQGVELTINVRKGKSGSVSYSFVSANIANLIK